MCNENEVSEHIQLDKKPLGQTIYLIHSVVLVPEKHLRPIHLLAIMYFFIIIFTPRCPNV